MVRIGVLALQGAFREHMDHLRDIPGVKAVEVRTAEDLENVQGLILPGGESTAIIRVMEESGLHHALMRRLENGLPAWGTCAGLILLATVVDNKPGFLKALDITVKRNAYGSQLSSFTTMKTVSPIHDTPLRCVFIRAPYIEKCGSKVEVLGIHEGHIIAARQGNILVTTYHPELTEDNTYHQFFVDSVKSQA